EIGGVGEGVRHPGVSDTSRDTLRHLTPPDALRHARAHSVAGAARPRRSRFQLYKAMARPLAVTAAATSGVAARPGPWSMVRPPSQAPPALPRLKAAMLKADARFGAPPAFSSTRICR